MPRLGTEDGQSALIPVPPFKEQTRIVAKVEQLMSLCDELEARKQRRDNERIALNATLLDELLSAESDKDFQKCWQRICDNFHLLYDNSENVGKLRQAILELAVRGRLVPQYPNDEPASVLLEKIRAEKERLIREKKIKRDRGVFSEKIQKPFDIPETWEWAYLGNVVDYGGGKKFNAEDVPQKAWLLELEDIEKDTSLIIQRIKAEERRPQSTKTFFDKGCVLYGKLRPYLNKVVVADAEGYCTTEILALRVFSDFSAHYLMYVLKSPFFLAYVNSKMYGMKMPRLGTEDGQSALIPVPPFKEQTRIVAKVEQLMSLCDQLETKIRQAQSDIESIMTEAVGSLISHETFKNHWREYESNSVKDIKEKQRQNAGKRFVAGFQDGNF